MILQFDSVNFSYPGGGRVFRSDLSFCVEAGDRVLVSGPPGSGVSTLCRLAIGSLSPASGKVSCRSSTVGIIDPVSIFRPEFDVRSNLALMACYYAEGCKASYKALAAEAVLAGFSLSVPVRTLSGSRKKLLASLVLPVLHGDLLVIDYWPNVKRDPGLSARLWATFDQNFSAIILTGGSGNSGLPITKELAL